MKVRIRLIGARPNFDMISENPNVSLDIVDCSLYARCVTLKEDYHKNRMYKLAYAPVENSYMETMAKTYIIPARQNDFFPGNIFKYIRKNTYTSISQCNEFKLCLFLYNLYSVFAQLSTVWLTF